MKTSLEVIHARIAQKTDSSGGPDACWPWKGARGGSGTCCLAVDRRHKPVRRLIWEMTRGPIPAEHVVSDTCGNKACVNPAHLRLRSFVLADRFWEKVDKSGGPDACWPYKEHCTVKGYGAFPIGEKGKYPAHRIAYELTYGVKLTSDQHAMHRCDNPPCCNPKHIEIGNHQANMADMLSKGRAHWQKRRAGLIKGPRKVPEHIKVELRLKHASGMSLVALAKTYKITDRTIARIVKAGSENGGDTNG